MDVIEHRSRQEAELLALLDSWMEKQPSDGMNKVAVIAIELQGATLLRSFPDAEQGERLLRELHQCISDRLRPDDRQVVLSDTELLVTLFDIKNAGHARLAVHKLLHALHDHHAGKLDTAHIKPFMGIALWPEVADNPRELLGLASLAVDRARNDDVQFFFYTMEEKKKKLFRWNIAAEIEHALKGDELVLHFQPQVSTTSGELLGAEALVHWNHPEHGYLPPGTFIPLVENSEAIHSLTRWCLHSALHQLTEWPLPSRPPSVSVNISSRNFTDPSFLDVVENALTLWDVPAYMLTLEITEGALLQDIDYATGMLDSLRGFGVRTSIDDFGTGYSSLSYLKALPVDELKIDQSFIRNIQAERADRNIVETIIKIARDFGLSVVAEGIEQDEVIGLLGELGCDIAQGFAIAKPLSGKDFYHWTVQQEMKLKRLHE